MLETSGQQGAEATAPSGCGPDHRRAAREMELPLFFWQLREVVLMSDLTHIPRRSFVTKAIREPPSVRNENWHEAGWWGEAHSTSFSARFDHDSVNQGVVNQGCRHIGRRP